MDNESLLLKFGTLKGWDLKTDASRAALQAWSDLGESMVVMSQDRSDAHKEAICVLIDTIDGEIQNDWTGEMLTKEAAKDYIRSYRK
jgi:hypothetical protein